VSIPFELNFNIQRERGVGELLFLRTGWALIGEVLTG